jgi:hypothetical protein
MVTRLPHLRHLYIDGFPVGFNEDQRDQHPSPSPPQLESLRIFRDHRDDKGLGSHITNYFRQSLRMDAGYVFTRTASVLVWRAQEITEHT